MDNQHRYGFRWSTQANGKDCPQPIRKTVVSGQDDVDDAATSVNIYPGDPVKLVDGGGVKVAQGVGAGEAADMVYGICVGIAPFWSVSEGVMRPGSYYPNQTVWGTKEARRGYVYVVPGHWGIWEVDCAFDWENQQDITHVDASYDTETEYKTLPGNNVEFICPGSALTGYGKATSADPYVDLNTVATTATLTFRIVDVSQTMENQDYSGAFTKLYVTLNEGNFAAMPATPTAGV